MKGIPCKIVYNKSVDYRGFVWLMGNKKTGNNSQEENRLLGLAYLRDIKEITNEQQTKEFLYLFGNTY